MPAVSQNLKNVEIEAYKLKAAIKEEGFNANSIAEAINSEYSGSNFKGHDVYNLVHRSYKKLHPKNLEKLELIAKVLKRPVSDFLINNEQASIENLEKVHIDFSKGYDGYLYRSTAQITEKILQEFGIEVTPQLIHEYAVDAHDIALKQKLDAPKMWEVYITGAIKSALKAGVIQKK